VFPWNLLKKAAAWCGFLEAHARRIYGMLNGDFKDTGKVPKADELLAWMCKQSQGKDMPLLRHRC
jgi:hypothetical protein